MNSEDAGREENCLDSLCTN